MSTTLHQSSSPDTAADPILDLLHGLQRKGQFAPNIAHIREIPPRPAQWRDFPPAMQPELCDVLRARGIERLFSHQAESIEQILAGKNVVVVTPTASGKTMCYNLPVAQALLANPQSRFLYLFPTKALSHDQYHELYSITQALGRDIKVYTYDGDTPPATRTKLRKAGHIIMTNPDMLHSGVLPHHPSWVQLFENLKYIVVDEIHQYRGVFGSHFANLMRRLRRICRHYDANPQFICSSATIANPKELVETLFEAPFEKIDNNGAPSGRKYFVIYNPPVINEELGLRKSSRLEATRLALRTLRRNMQTIIFGRSRLSVEVIATYLKRAMARMGKGGDRIKAYRGGYLPNERRDIEQGVKRGSVLGVVSTNALELGIDIGQLRASIMVGYPGSVASAWQQAGRAGRKAETSLAILVANSSPLDQYLVNHPDYFFGAPPEQGIVNPNNIPILSAHLKCAVFEDPIGEGEGFGNYNPASLLEYFERQNIMRKSGGRWHWSAENFPAEEISLRSASPNNFIVINTADNNRTIAEVDYESAAFLIHTEAIYMHQSQTFHVDNLDWDGRAAYVRPVKVDYYTDAVASTGIKVIYVDREAGYGVASYGSAGILPASDDVGQASLPANASDISKINTEQSSGSHLDYLLPPGHVSLVTKNFGEVTVSTVVPKYKKVKLETHESVGYGYIHLPEFQIDTEAWWITFDPELVERFRERHLNLGAYLQGIAHLLGNVVPLYVLCDPRDFSSVAMAKSPHDLRPTVYVYDRYAGGIGIASRAFDLDRDIIATARQIVSECPCVAGCPSCIGPDFGPLDYAKPIVQRLLQTTGC